APPRIAPFDQAELPSCRRRAFPSTASESVDTVSHRLLWVPALAALGRDGTSDNTRALLFRRVADRRMVRVPTLVPCVPPLHRRAGSGGRLPVTWPTMPALTLLPRARARFDSLPGAVRGAAWMTFSSVLFSINAAAVRHLAGEVHPFELSFFRALF